MQIFKRISFKTLKCNFVLRTFDSVRRLNYLFNWTILVMIRCLDYKIRWDSKLSITTHCLELWKIFNFGILLSYIISSVHYLVFICLLFPCWSKVVRTDEHLHTLSPHSLNSMYICILSLIGYPQIISMADKGVHCFEPLSGKFCLLSAGTPFKNFLDPPPLNMSSYRKMFNDLWKCLNIEIVSTIMTFKLKKLYILTLFSVAFGHNFLIFLFFMWFCFLSECFRITTT